MVPGIQIKGKSLLILRAETGKWCLTTRSVISRNHSQGFRVISSKLSYWSQLQRIWSFTIKVKKTHSHTFSPKSGKEQQVLLLRSPKKKLHRLEPSHYYKGCISQTQMYKIILHFAKCRRNKGTSENRNALTSLSAKKSQAKWISLLHQVLDPAAPLTMTCSFLYSLSTLFIIQQPCSSQRQSVLSVPGAANCSISFQTLMAGQRFPEPVWNWRDLTDPSIRNSDGITKGGKIPWHNETCG